MTISGDRFLTLSHHTRRYGDENKLGFPSRIPELIFLQRLRAFSVRNVKKRDRIRCELNEPNDVYGVKLAGRINIVPNNEFRPSHNYPTIPTTNIFFHNKHSHFNDAIPCAMPSLNSTLRHLSGFYRWSVFPYPPPRIQIPVLYGGIE